MNIVVKYIGNFRALTNCLIIKHLQWLHFSCRVCRPKYVYNLIIFQKYLNTFVL